MSSYNPERLIFDLATWLPERYQTTTSAVEGGWEYWIQIDFMSWLNLRGLFDVRREVNINGSRADLFLNLGAGIGVPPLPRFPPAWVEIKAQGAKYLNDRFKLDVQADIDKMAGAGVPCEQYMLVALSDGDLIDDVMFAPGSGYHRVWRDTETDVVVLLRRTA